MLLLYGMRSSERVAKSVGETQEHAPDRHQQCFKGVGIGAVITCF